MIFQVSESRTNILLSITIITLIIPIIPIIYFLIKKKFNSRSMIMVVVGALTFTIFVLCLEKIIHLIVFSLFPNLKNLIWAYGAYGGFMAALFEETGRLIIFMIISLNFIPEKNENLNSIFYGIGHGGIEVYLLVSLTTFTQYKYCKKAISGELDKNIKSLSQNEINQLLLLFKAVNKLTKMSAFYTILERIIAVNYHICASVIVWIGVMKNKCLKMYLIAFSLHFFTDFSISFQKEFRFYSNVNVLVYTIFIDFSLLTLIISMIFWIKYIDKEKAQSLDSLIQSKGEETKF